MKNLEILKYLFDIKQACEFIFRVIKDKEFTDYQEDELLRSAIERKLEIIGEALNNALKLCPELESHISHSRRIISFRNRIIHGYDIIEDEFVWGIIRSYLPILYDEIEKLLSSSHLI